MEDQLLWAARHSQHALGAIKFALFLWQSGNGPYPALEHQLIHLKAVAHDAETADLRVVSRSIVAMSVTVAATLAMTTTMTTSAMTTTMTTTMVAAAVIASMITVPMPAMPMSMSMSMTVTNLLLNDDTVHVVRANVCELCCRNNALHACNDWCILIERTDPTPDFHCIVIIDKIDLIEEDLVSKSYLAVTLLIVLATGTLS
mmetsp:Transcript_67274/g.123878  ORF Transcript_67274/g.123878 Transcript_67274/m.123878 type:complete len:202 (+) Transcript_67274:1129-1734(+)